MAGTVEETPKKAAANRLPLSQYRNGSEGMLAVLALRHERNTALPAPLGRPNRHGRLIPFQAAIAASAIRTSCAHSNSRQGRPTVPVERSARAGQVELGEQGVDDPGIRLEKRRRAAGPQRVTS
jgi:hypothetical protein